MLGRALKEHWSDLFRFTWETRIVLALMWSATAGAQAARVAPIEQVADDVALLLRDYPRREKAAFMHDIIGALAANGFVDQSIRLITRATGEDDLLLHPARALLKGGRPDSAMRVLSLARDMSSRQNLQTNVFWGLTDTSQILALATQLPDDVTRAHALGTASGGDRIDDKSRHVLLQHALRYALADKTPRGHDALLHIAYRMRTLGDLSGARLADQDSVLIQSRQYPRFVVDVAASLRARGSPLADSVYSRARLLSERAAVKRTSGGDMEYYWSHFMPSLADTNPLRYLREMGGASHTAFLQGVMAIHLADGRTEVPFRVFEQRLALGDTARAVNLLMSAYVSFIDDYLWQPRGRSDLLPILVRRALIVAEQSSDTTLQQSLRRWSDALTRIANTSDEAAPDEQPLSTQQRDAWLLARLPIYLTFPRGERALATADSISDPTVRTKALVAVAAAGFLDNDRPRRLRVINEAVQQLDATADYTWTSQHLLPLMVRVGMRRDAEDWAQRQPADKRVHAMAALLIGLAQGNTAGRSRR